MKRVDINCDMGEGMENDEELMPYITAANIACGYHAGDEATMRTTIQLCLEHGVSIGAHPSYQDKENFGRKEMQLEPAEVYKIVQEQLLLLSGLTKEYHAKLIHVKPHGALYNVAAKDIKTAGAIVKAIKDFDEKLEVVGLSGSIFLKEAEAHGLKVMHEAFADRTYSDDGSLTPRSAPGALISDEERAALQVMQMINEDLVTTLQGNKIPIIADTICIHSDGENAVKIAKRIKGLMNKKLQQK